MLLRMYLAASPVLSKIQSSEHTYIFMHKSIDLIAHIYLQVDCHLVEVGKHLSKI